MNVQWQRRLTWIAILLILGISLAYGLRPQPRLVDIAIAERAPMKVTIVEEGKTRVIDRFIITAPVPGTTCRIDLDVGDSVGKNQMLVNINPLQSQGLDPRSKAEAGARVEAAQSALLSAQQTVQSAGAEAELAMSELNRLMPLQEQGHISQDKIDQARARKRSTEATLKSTEFAVDVARHELEAAKTALRYTGITTKSPEHGSVKVFSPIEGNVLKLHQECEGVVNAGQPLLEIGDTRSLEIETDVLSIDAVKIKPDMPIIYERWGGEQPLNGRVRRIEPVGFTKISALGVEEQRVLIISDITSDVDQWASLGDGYRVESHFILWESDEVLQIPASALFRMNDHWTVFIMENGKASLRQVTVGQRNGLSAEILSGLMENDQVITHPDDSITEGVAVKAR